MVRNLHEALKTEVIEKATDAGCDFVLARMQWSKTDTAIGLHVNPNMYSTFGIQRPDFLSLLGFQRTPCVFLPGGECFAKEVTEGFDLSAFGRRFGQAYEKLEKAERSLQACGYILPQPQGWGYFFGKSTQRENRFSWVGDGHSAGKIEQLKKSDDTTFTFQLTWTESSNGAKGWSIHYRPKHGTLSAEIDGVMNLLGLKVFKSCPEFDFEPCNYRFISFESREGDFFGSNAQAVHNCFDMHARNFSVGVENLLQAHALMESSGFRLIPIQDKTLRHRQEIRTRVIQPSNQKAEKFSPRNTESNFPFDVAVSFAGANRSHARDLATRIGDAGFSVFYDEFYPEDLWGKDLTVFFDEIFRKQSRYCVMFMSKEYLERKWTIYERRSAMARAVEERGNEYILPIKVDDVDIPGLAPTIAYLPISRGIPDIADLLIKKLAGIPVAPSNPSTSDGKKLEDVRRELRKHQFAIANEENTNQYQVHFKKLREFYIENHDLFERYERNRTFFREWLQDPFIGQEFADSTWTQEKMAKLQIDVAELKI